MQDIPLAKVGNAIRGEYIVIILPRELGLYETLRGETLKSLDDLEIRNIKVFVLRRIKVFFSHKNTLYRTSTTVRTAIKFKDRLKHTFEEVLVDDTPVLFRDDHAGLTVLRNSSGYWKSKKKGLTRSFKRHLKGIKSIQPIPTEQIAQKAIP